MFKKNLPQGFQHLCGTESKGDDWRGTVLLMHGMDGHPVNTWRHPRDKTTWYEELVKGIPGLGCATVHFGYSRAKSDQEKEKLLERHSQEFLASLEKAKLLDRPLFCVAHSLGGVMFKRALADAQNMDPNGYFADRRINVCGVVFLGVPHLGSPWIKNPLRPVVANSETAADLHPSARSNADTHQRFLGTLSRYPHTRIMSVHETLGPSLSEFVKLPFSLGPLDRLRPSCVVPATSSQLGIDREENFHAVASHLSLPNFRYTGADRELEAIRAMISSWVRPRDASAWNWIPESR